MSKYFPKLSQTHVRIDVAEGNNIAVPMLPVGAIGTLNELSKRLGETSSMEAIAAMREEMITLAESVIPKEYHANLQRFGVDTLAELLAYLMYGDGNDQPEQPQPEKN